MTWTRKGSTKNTKIQSSSNITFNSQFVVFAIKRLIQCADLIFMGHICTSHVPLSEIPGEYRRDNEASPWTDSSYEKTRFERSFDEFKGEFRFWRFQRASIISCTETLFKFAQLELIKRLHFVRTPLFNLCLISHIS